MFSNSYKVKYEKPDPVYQMQKCERCGRFRLCTWHHLYLRRYSDAWIWLCVFNGFEAGCHEFVHANPAQAKDNGYLLRHNTSKEMKKTKKKTKCDHSSTYYSKEVGDFICQYCKKIIGELRTGKKKKK